MNISGLLIFPTLVLLLAAVPAEGQNTPKDLTNQSSLIFEGTIETNGGAAPSRVATVRVDRILDKPASVAMMTGQSVMVKLKGPEPIPVGARVLFYANGRIFGDTLTTEEVGHAVMSQGPAAAAAQPDSTAQIARARQEAAEDQLRSRLNSASAVIVGRVGQVRLPSGGIAALDQGGRLPISEHDPQLREAVNDVQDSIKGATPGESVIVRFPASKDVKRIKYPKLETGQSGTFILHGDNVSGLATANLGGSTVPAYTVRQSTDILPTAEAGRVRELLK
jgi:hypothetical protein